MRRKPTLSDQIAFEFGISCDYSLTMPREPQCSARADHLVQHGEFKLCLCETHKNKFIAASSPMTTWFCDRMLKVS